MIVLDHTTLDMMAGFGQSARNGAHARSHRNTTTTAAAVVREKSKADRYRSSSSSSSNQQRSTSKRAREVSLSAALSREKRKHRCDTTVCRPPVAGDLAAV